MKIGSNFLSKTTLSGIPTYCDVGSCRSSFALTGCRTFTAVVRGYIYTELDAIPPVKRLLIAWSSKMDLTLTLGALYDGAVVSTVLYGLTCGQTYRYFKAYPDDKITLRIMVFLTFLLDTFERLLLGHALWFYLIRKCDGHSPSDTTPIWSYYGVIIPAQLSIFIVQCFYIRRIWSLGQRKLTLLLVLGAVLELLAGIGFIVTAYMTNDLYLDSYHTTTLAAHNVILYIGACSTLLTDIGITFSMCSLLYQVRRSSLETSRSVLDTLFNYAMTTGLLVTILTAVLMIVSSALPNTLLFDGLYLSAGKLYINSMLAALNSRQSLRARLGDIVQEIPLQSNDIVQESPTIKPQ